MRLFPGLLLCLLPLPGLSAPSQDWSAALAADGLARTEAALSALAAPTPDDRFALGGVRFLRGIEQALQLRWQLGAVEEIAPLPILRLDLPLNRAPEPMRASLVAEIFGGALAQMALAETTLAAIPEGADIGLTIRLEDLWFDITGDGQRGIGEDLLPLALDNFTMPWSEPGGLTSTSIRFDSADVFWLRAYGQLISGLSSFVLAFDPTAATARLMAAADDEKTRLASPNPSAIDEFDVSGWVDKAASAILALRQQPDPALTRQSRAHLMQMVALNRQFWRAVATETDNQEEWIPNARQTAALGFDMPADTDVVWLGVLSELEQLLDGKLLVPHIALPPEAGINIAAWMENPNPLDLVGWIQGMDALPYAERGPMITGTAWTAFEQLVGGRGVLYALLLN